MEWSTCCCVSCCCVLCQKLSRKERAQLRVRGGNNISVGQIHASGPSDIPNTHTHTWTTSEVGSVFSEWWINMNSVSKLPSLRHFPTNRLNTLCSVIPPPPSFYCLHPHFLCVCLRQSLSLRLPIYLIVFCLPEQFIPLCLTPCLFFFYFWFPFLSQLLNMIIALVKCCY